jgi:oligopeptide/dipeptide ABC transporter ATP-binding protein
MTSTPPSGGPETTPAASTILAVRDLKVGYPVEGGTFVPVRNLTFSIAEREVVGLVGDAGSGKSTAALALVGLTRPPGRIMNGRVEFLGEDLLAMSEDRLRAIRGRDIGYIVQNPRGSLNPMISVGRQIEYAYLAHNEAGRSDSRSHAIDMLKMVGINDPERRYDSFAHELSGGMAQRALIAMALSSSPRLLIADEPTSGLDVTIQAQFLDQMWKTVRETGSAMLLVSQELGVIANYCDRVLVMHDGVIVEDAPVREFFAAPRHAYSQEVLRLYRERGGAFPKALPPGEGVPLITLGGLTKHFPIRGSDKVVQAVDKVDLTIRKGESIGLVGESGSGKTTVGRCLLQLIRPTAGSVAYGSADLTKIAADVMRRYRSKLQIVFQDPYESLNPRWTIAELLAEPLRVHTRLSRQEMRRKAAEVLRLVRLDETLLDRKPRGLGAGTLQRINIARALICEPEFIVLDEPTSVLAPRARNELIELLARLQKELGLAYLFISHDLTTVRYLCQRVAVMYLGQIVEEGSVEDVFTAPKHPYSRALLSAHLFPDPTRRRVDYPVAAQLEGEIPSPIDVPKGCYLASRCPFHRDECKAPQPLVALAPGRTVRCVRVVEGSLDMPAPSAAH